MIIKGDNKFCNDCTSAQGMIWEMSEEIYSARKTPIKQIGIDEHFFSDTELNKYMMWCRWREMIAM